MKNFGIILTFILIGFQLSAQPSERRTSKQEYVEQWADVAVQSMVTHGIPASITLAQGILESAYGNSTLAKYANNHFGIKCHNWDGKGFYKDDDKKDECFRRYNSADESFEDHALFLKKSRYASLFDLKITDYKSWAKGLKKAGYATNPKYADLLIQIIEDNELYKYDKMKSIDKIEPVINQSVVEEQSIAVYKWHVVKEHFNSIKFVEVKPGDTVYKIAKEFGMNMWQIYKYNDFAPEQDVLEVGSYVYLQPKKVKSKKNRKTFIVNQANTALRTVSQLEGIKLKKLEKRNLEYSTDQVLSIGAKITLR